MIINHNNNDTVRLGNNLLLNKYLLLEEDCRRIWLHHKVKSNCHPVKRDWNHNYSFILKPYLFGGRNGQTTQKWIRLVNILQFLVMIMIYPDKILLFTLFTLGLLSSSLFLSSTVSAVVFSGLPQMYIDIPIYDKPLDISEVFDNIWYTGHFPKLKTYGVNERTILSNFKMKVALNSHSSRRFYIFMQMSSRDLSSALLCFKFTLRSTLNMVSMRMTQFGSWFQKPPPACC